MIRAVIVGGVCFAVGLVLYPFLVTRLVRRGVGQNVASYSPLTHRIKQGTPTLGGLLFCAIVIVTWLVADRSREGFIAVFALIAGAAVGGLDDVVNIRSLRRLGLPAWHRLAVEGFIGLLLGIALAVAGFTHQYFPGLGAPNLGWGIVPVAVLALVATSNAVNLTDGVDGLAASCTGIAFFGLTMVGVRTGDVHATLIAAALTGAVVAFLVYNWHPARIFMGDTGSLALGCVLVAVSSELHLLWALPLLGLVFLVEAASVIINVTAIRRYGRRIFKASPLHHHFEELGLREQRLVAAFAAVGAVAAMFTVLLAHFAGPA